MEKKADFRKELSSFYKDNPAPFLAAGAGALVGGGLTALKKREEGESRLKRLGRILANAGIVGGSAGLGTHLLQTSAKGFQSVLPEDDVSMTEAAGNLLTNPDIYSAGLTGAAGTALYGKTMGRDSKRLENIIRQQTTSATPDGPSFLREVANKRKGVPGSLASKVEKEFLDNHRARNQQRYLNSARGRADAAASRLRAGTPMSPHAQGILRGDLASAGLDPRLGKFKGALHRHGGRLVGRSAQANAVRALILGGAASSPYIAAKGLEKLTQGPDPSMYERD